MLTENKVDAFETFDCSKNNINTISSGVMIDADLISNTATAGDEHDVITGYYAIKFMLWDQDLNVESDTLTADTFHAREISTTGDILNSGGIVH